MGAPLVLHATCVAWEGRGALILGPSGSGKSALALALMALGCTLVADDRTEVRPEAGRLVARCPRAIRGLIEARGVGLLAAASRDAAVVVAVDLGEVEAERLPPWREALVAGVALPCLWDPRPRHAVAVRHHIVDTGHFAAAILQYLKGGRRFPAPPEAPMRDSAPASLPHPTLADDASGPGPDLTPGLGDDPGLRAAPPTDAVEAMPRVVLVTGPSGAGRTTAIRALEDLGFEVIDNLPLSLLPRLVEGPVTRPLALGLDVRNRDFGTDALIEAIDRLAARPDIRAHVLYLDAEADVLQRRYSETRRRHPLAPDGPPAHGIARERALLIPIRARADILIDTGALTPHDLRAEVEGWFAPTGGRPLSLSIESFSYKRGLPRGLDIVLDCRFLRNPHWDESLRARDGRDPGVAAFVRADPRHADFFVRVRDLTLSLLPAYREEGKAHLSIGFGCTGGQHRSVALAESLAKALAEAGWQVSKRHRELERRAEAAGMAPAGPMSGTAS